MATSDRALTRRRFTKIATLSAAGLTLPRPAAGDQSETQDLRSELLMEMELEIAIGRSLGSCQVAPITGGIFEGPRLRGTALAGGGNWLIHRPDGISELNVRCTLQTDDAQLISMWYRGLVHAAAGGEQHVRTTPVFDTASSTYGWLNRIIAVGVARQILGKATYRVYEIL